MLSFTKRQAASAWLQGGERSGTSDAGRPGRAGEAAGSERCTSTRLPDEREWGTDALMTCAPRTNQRHVNLSEGLLGAIT